MAARPRAAIRRAGRGRSGAGGTRCGTACAVGAGCAGPCRRCAQPRRHGGVARGGPRGPRGLAVARAAAAGAAGPGRGAVGAAPAGARVSGTARADRRRRATAAAGPGQRRSGACHRGAARRGGAAPAGAAGAAAGTGALVALATPRRFVREGWRWLRVLLGQELANALHGLLRQGLRGAAGAAAVSAVRQGLAPSADRPGAGRSLS